LIIIYNPTNVCPSLIVKFISTFEAVPVIWSFELTVTYVMVSC